MIGRISEQQDILIILISSEIFGCREEGRGWRGNLFSWRGDGWALLTVFLKKAFAVCTTKEKLSDMKMKTLSALFLIVFFAACTVKLVTPIQADADRAVPKYPGYTLADLNEGKSLYESTCNRCHGLKNPRSRDEEKWKKIVPKMIARLTKKEGKEVIDAKQQESILRYLVTMSEAPKR